MIFENIEEALEESIENWQTIKNLNHPSSMVSDQTNRSNRTFIVKMKVFPILNSFFSSTRAEGKKMSMPTFSLSSLPHQGHVKNDAQSQCQCSAALSQSHLTA